MDLFLWPMLVPMIIPVVYCWKYSKDSLGKLWPIILSMVLIVVLYTSMFGIIPVPYHVDYTLIKFILFVFMPLAILYMWDRKRPLKERLADFGIRKKGTEESLKLSAFVLPAMLASIAFTSFMLERSYNPSEPIYSILSFFESFTEEFFFRGILFLYLWKFVDIRIAYITSMASFILMHPQYFWGLAILPGIVQTILTTIIAHKTKNIAGPWVLHGASRIFAMSFLPWFL